MLAAVTAAVAVGAPAQASERSTLSGATASDKLSSRLVALATPELRSASPAAQAAGLSLPPRGPGSLLRAGKGVIVDARVTRTSDGVLRVVRAAGATILHVSARYRTVTVAVTIAHLHRLAAIPGVEAVIEELAPLSAGSGVAGGAGPTAATATCQGAATSEGDAQLLADKARQSYGVSGLGTEVGVLSDSFDAASSAPTHADDDIASGDLPGPGNPCGRTTPVDVIDETDYPANATDEGRAMAQIVHDLAPDALLSFASAVNGLTAFADNVRALQAAGADVIVDDISYPVDPFFQNGPVGVAVDDVTAAGAVSFTAAGNANAIIGGNNVASWEAPSFRVTSCPTGAPSYATHCMDFDPSATVDNDFAITVNSGGSLRLDLQWAEPWYGVSTDINAYLLDSSNQIVAYSEYFNPTNTQTPFEFLYYQNNTGSSQTVRLVIDKYQGAANPRLKFILVRSPGMTGLEYSQSSGGDIVGPTIFGHHSAANEMSVAAIPYNNGATIEPYSSRGPATFYFGPVTGTTPAAPLPTPAVLAKPDLSATDGGANTFFGFFTGGVWRFYGTSASAPHAAAVAALELDGFPSATVAQVKNAQRTTASPVGAFGADAGGAGLVNAKAAVAKLLPGVTIADVAKPEGNSGTQAFAFTLTLSKPSPVETKVKYSTADGTATAGSDYVAASGTVRFLPGVTTRKVSVTVNGDTTVEPNETFSVQLKRPTRLKITDKSGTGTIQNDD